MPETTFQLDTEVTEAHLNDLLDSIHNHFILPNQRFFRNVQLTTVENERLLAFTVLGPTGEWYINVEVRARKPVLVRMVPSDERLPQMYLDRIKNDLILNVRFFEEKVRKTTLYFSWVEGKEIIPEKVVYRERPTNRLFFDSMLPLFIVFMLLSIFIAYSFGELAPIILVASQLVLVMLSPAIVSRMGEWVITQEEPSIHFLTYEMSLGEYTEFRQKFDKASVLALKKEIYQKTVALKGELDCLAVQDIFTRYGLKCLPENLSSKKTNVYQIVKRAADIYNVRVPKIVISNTTLPNAAASGPSPNYGTVLITTGLLAQLEEDEVFSVLGHEFAHLKGRDSLSLFVLFISEYLFRVYVFFPFLLSLPLSYSAFFSLYYLYLPLSLGLVYFIGKFFEARADLESAVKVGMPKVLAQALRKIGFRRLQFEERAPAYRVQSWFAWDPHPPLYYRIARLERMETPVTVRHTFIQSMKDVVRGFAEALGIR